MTKITTEQFMAVSQLPGFWFNWHQVILVCGRVCGRTYGLYISVACCHVILWQGLGLGKRKVEEFGLISYQYSPLLLLPPKGAFFTPFLSFFFWPHHVAYGISVLQPGIEPVTPAFNPWMTREVPVLISAQFSSVAQSRPTLCDPMDCSTPGFPVHHQLLEPTQTHVHHVSDAIHPSPPLLSPSPPANCQ